MGTVQIEPTPAAMSQSVGLSWSIPRWSKARGLAKVWPIVFGTGPVLRIVGISLLAGAVTCAALKAAFPLIQLGAAWWCLLAIPAMFGYVAVMMLLQWAFPGNVRISEKWLLCSQGQSAWRVRRSEIEEARLIVFSSDHILLRFRARGRTRRIAVAPTTDLQQLASLLAITDVCDRRLAFTAARRRVMLPKN